MSGFDELWPGGPRFKQTREGFRLSTDSVLLAAFANMKKVRRCLDLGCGAGVLCVLLGEKAPEARITGIELQPEAAELSRENLRENGMDVRSEILAADLRDHASLLPAGEFDLVVSNPPYFPQNSGFSAPEAARARAREERDCSLEDVCAAAGQALRWGGSFCLVHRPERLADIFRAMAAFGMEPKRMRTVHYSPARAPSLVLIEGRRGGRPGLDVEKPLILTGEDGGDSAEVRKIYRRGEFSPPAKGAEEL